MRGRKLLERLEMIMRSEQPWRTNRSAVLRAHATNAELRLWAQVRDRRLGGFKFVRQAPVGPYFVDFLCRVRKVVVEVDGGTHGSVAEIRNDAARTRELERLGYRVMRVTNADVMGNIEGVLDSLLAVLNGDA